VVRLTAATLCLALGILIKPNFAVVLVFFVTGRVAPHDGQPSSADTAWWRNHLGPPALAAIACILFLAVTVAVPGGVRLETYQAFLTDVRPILAQKAFAPNNISAAGLLLQCLPFRVPPALIAMGLAAVCAAVGYRHRWSWPQWIIACLLVSPITWTSYTGLLLPVQLLLLARFTRTYTTPFQACLACLSIGAIWIDRTGVGCAVLLTCLALSVTSSERVHS